MTKLLYHERSSFMRHDIFIRSYLEPKLKILCKILVKIDHAIYNNNLYN